MKIFRSIAALGLVFAMGVSFAGCATNDGAEASDTTAPVVAEDVTESSAEDSKAVADNVTEASAEALRRRSCALALFFIRPIRL